MPLLYIVGSERGNLRSVLNERFRFSVVQWHITLDLAAGGVLDSLHPIQYSGVLANDLLALTAVVYAADHRIER